MKTFRKIPKRYLKSVLQGKDVATCLYFFVTPKASRTRKFVSRSLGTNTSVPRLPPVTMVPWWYTSSSPLWLHLLRLPGEPSDGPIACSVDEQMSQTGMPLWYYKIPGSWWVILVVDWILESEWHLDLASGFFWCKWSAERTNVSCQGVLHQFSFA